MQDFMNLQDYLMKFARIISEIARFLIRIARLCWFEGEQNVCKLMFLERRTAKIGALIGFLINLQFFTAIPFKKELPMEKKYIHRAIQTFPLVGILLGLIMGGVLYALVEWTPFSTLAIAFILWLLTIVLTGGLHLDGWIDASDAFFSYQDASATFGDYERLADRCLWCHFGHCAPGHAFFIYYEIVGRLNEWSYFLIILHAIPE